MKLATLNNESRDGVLVVVNKALTACAKVPMIAATMQEALDNWKECESELQKVYEQLNIGKYEKAFAFDVHNAMAPIPRAYQWADGSAYVNHVELVRKARGVEMPENFWIDPLMYQGGSDTLMGACDDILALHESDGIDFEAEVAVITNDVAMDCSVQDAAKSILLLMLVNDVSLRNLIPAEIAKGFGFFQSKPATAFSPVAVTPDELGKHWDGKKINLPLYSYLNNTLFGSPNAGVDMTFDFPTLIAHAAKTRFLIAGTIIGSGTVSNIDKSTGSSCIAERRMLEILEKGKPQTSFMKFGDTIRIEMLDENRQSIFGAISQKVVSYSKVPYADAV